MIKLSKPYEKQEGLYDKTQAHMTQEKTKVKSVCLEEFLIIEV